MAGVGTVIAYWGLDDPKQSESEEETWLLCDGREVKRKDYPELHVLVGEIFGAGDNLTTFNLPDLRGRFIRGLDWGPDPKHPEGAPVSSGRDPELKERTSMGTGMTTEDPVIGSLQPCALEEHWHLIRGVRNAWPGLGGGQRSSFSHTSTSSETWGAWGETEVEGGKETRPSNTYVNYLIRVA